MSKDKLIAVRAADRPAAVKALAENRIHSIRVDYDDYTYEYRLVVLFRDAPTGPLCAYTSKPFPNGSYQEIATEAARRVERLGASREDVKQWIQTQFDPSKIDLDALFRKKKATAPTVTLKELRTLNPNMPEHAFDEIRKVIEEKGECLKYGRHRRLVARIVA